MKYEDGEIWWWEVRDTDAHIKKRIEQCYKAVARKDMATINSFLCLFQSFKYNLQIDFLNFVKDTMAYANQHRSMLIAIVSVDHRNRTRRSVSRQQAADNGHGDGESVYSEKVEGNIKEILEDWEKVNTESNHLPVSEMSANKRTSAHRFKGSKIHLRNLSQDSPKRSIFAKHAK
ncbi:hypothetical protein HELRODRAFT_161395 [Helobdella robusta]|uniref:Uncharacterized protein n=1 Tax=Helobdella robusta TaxID=6412 RepID=T1ERF7_HELRO|nr:hypothetical protein HELRODRAFT_161395 [Helobdella robusta]ESO02158.1 hypothetical protein HELRODRAFT_161395 [Helobdella robusta]